MWRESEAVAFLFASGLLIFSLGQHGAAGLCFESGIAASERVRFENAGGEEVPFGIWQLDWDSGNLVRLVVTTLIEEKLGVETAISGSSQSSRAAMHAMGNCILETDTFTCSDDYFEVTTHGLLEMWSAQAWNYEWFVANYPDIAPVHLGNMGYVGQEEMYVMHESISAGLAAGRHMNFYGDYNSSFVRPSDFFDSVSSIPTDILTFCNESSFMDPTVMARITSFVSDPTGFDESGRAVCSDAYWWRSPSCRETPELCVPYVTYGSAGYGWLVPEAMIRSIAYNMPVAITVVASWSTYLSLPKERNIITYSWEPTMHFLEISPELIMFPDYNAEAHALGDTRTRKDSIDLMNFAHHDLESEAPDVFKLLGSVTFTKTNILDMFQLVMAGQSHAEAACSWLTANQEIWESWLPDPTTCSAGRGMVDEDGNFVASRSDAETCSPCKAGYYSSLITDDMGETYICTACAAGTYQTMWGSTTCSDCELGLAQSEVGQSQCDRCERGTYANSTGSSACLACPTGTTTDGTGFQSAEYCMCPPRTYMLSNGKCLDCGDYADCGGFGAAPQSLPGYNLQTVSDTGLSIFSCSVAEHCPGGLVGRDCAAGRTGIACAECKPEMVPGNNGECIACGGSDQAPFVGAVVVTVFCLSLLYYAMTKQDKARQSFTVALLTTMFSQFVSVLQLMGVLSRLAVEWLEPVRTAMKFFTIFSLDVEVIRLNCVATLSLSIVYVSKLLILPIVVIFLLFLHVLLSKVCCRQHAGLWRRTTISSVGVLFMAFFVTISVTVFVPFQCIQHPNGKWTVLQFESEQCWEGGDHTTMIAAACLAVLMPISFLAVVTHLLRVFPQRMHQGDIGFLSNYSFLFARVKPEMRWYTLALLIRNLLVAMVLVVPSAFWQIFLMQCTFGVSVCCSLFFRPWAVHAANVLDVAGTVLILGLFTLAAFFTDGTGTESLAILALVASIVVVALFPLAILVAILRSVMRQKPFTWFICHHKASSGAFARLLKLSLVDRRRDNVFLDSDNLRDLSQLFHIVKSDTETLVVLATRGVVNSPWCVGEITTSHLNNVKCCPIKFPGFVLSVSDCLQQLEKHPEWPRLGESGLSRQSMEEALAWMVSQIEIEIDEAYSVGLVADIVNEVRKHHQIGCASFRGMSVAETPSRITSSGSSKRSGGASRAVTTIATSGPDSHQSVGTLVVVDCANREGLATGLILVKLLSPLWTQEPGKIPIVLDTTTVKMPSFDWGNKTIILVLTVSCFSSSRFLMDLLCFAGTRLRGLVPVVASDLFEFPTQSFYEVLERQVLALGSEAQVKIQPDLLTVFVETVFERICKRFSPHASIETLSMEAKIIWKEVEDSRPFRTSKAWDLEQSKAVTVLRGSVVPRLSSCRALAMEEELETVQPVQSHHSDLACVTYSI